MTQVGEGIAVTQVKDPEEDHWAQLEYTYPDGSPVQGMFTAVDGSGMTWTGYLNDQGQACLSGLPPGSVDYQLLPSESLEDELTELRTQIQTVLDGILEEQRAEAKAHQDELDKQSTLGKSVSYTAAVGRGLWNGAIGLLTFAKDVVVKAGELALFMSPVTRMNNLLQASYTSYRNGELTWTDWRESLTKNYQDEEFKDLADLLGIDIRNLDKDEVLSIITEAYEIVAYIADDAEFREMFIQFGKDYAGAQSSIEWAEFAGGGLFEIVLTALLLAFTGGLGNAAQIASKIRHAARLRTLGGMLRKLGKLLQRKKISQKTKGGVDSKQKVTAEKPEGQRLSSGEDKISKLASPKPGDVSEAPEYLNLVSGFKQLSQNDIADFYKDLEKKGIDYRNIATAIEKYDMTPDEAHAVFGYTAKLFYRDLNVALASGPSTEATQLANLVSSGIGKMPDAGPIQFRGIRLDGDDKIKSFDDAYGLGKSVESNFWSTAENSTDAYIGTRNLQIETKSAKDISDLAFGVQFHDKVGKPVYSAETIIPPGKNFKVVGQTPEGRILLREMP
jgi:hypothetical protein